MLTNRRGDEKGMRMNIVKNKKIAVAIVAMAVTIVSGGFADELRSFLGCRFGGSVLDGKFSGPDEDGDYFFLPEGKKPSLMASYFVSVTHLSKRVYCVSCSHAMAESQVKTAFLQYFNILDKGYGRIGVRPDKKGRFKYFSELKHSYPDLKDSEFVVWEFKNAAGETCQILQLIVKREFGLSIILVNCIDVKLSQKDDEEKCGTRN